MPLPHTPSPRRGIPQHALRCGASRWAAALPWRSPPRNRLHASCSKSPFTSIADLGAHIYWFLPVRWLIKDAFHSDLRIGKVRAPVLILHGERDQVVPIAFGERLYARINAAKRFVRFPHGGHNDLGVHGALDIAKQFIAGE